MSRTTRAYEEVRLRDWAIPDPAGQNALWRPWSPATPEKMAPEFVRGVGFEIWDIHGVRYIDGTSAAMNAACGHGRAEIIDAVDEQLHQIAHFDLSVALTTPPVLLAQRLASLLPAALDHVLFASSGAEAIEAAIRVAWDYWRLRGQPRERVVSFAAGYHGSTLLARHLSGLAFTAIDTPPPFEVTRVEPASEPRELRRPQSLGALSAAFRQAVQQGPPPAAVIVETMLNVGGGVVLPPGFLTELREICTQAGTLLVIDEVFCGFGRTGAMFGFDHDGISPDLVTMSKGITGGYLPLSAVAVIDTVVEVFQAADAALPCGHTTSGHAVAAAAALATLDVIEKERVVEAAAIRGGQLLELVEPLRLHGGVRDVRGLGLVVVVEFDDESTATAVGAQTRRNGLLLRQQRNSLMAIPPLVISDDGVAEIAEIWRRSVRETEGVAK
jgi:adenosylmethionine-8-amino-7-oxononanoate aminotransferase